MRKQQTHKQHDSGFTLVEMLVVAPMIIIIIGVFVAAIISITGSVLAERDSNATEYNIQDAISRIKQDVELSGGFLSTNNIDIAAPQGYDNGTQDFHNVSSNASIGSMLILNMKVTSKSSYNSDRNIIYAKDQPNACNSTQYTKNSTFMANVVYFVKNNSLWRRVLLPSNYATFACGSFWQKPSCDPTISNEFCKAKDIKLVSGVSSSNFTIKYYPTPSSSSENTTAINTSSNDTTRQYALLATNTIEVTIKSETTSAGRTITRSGTGRASSPNNNINSLIITSHPSNQTVSSGSNTSFSSSTSKSSASIQWQRSTNLGSTWSDIVGETSSPLAVNAVTDTMDGYLYRAVFTDGANKVTSNFARLTVNKNSWTEWADNTFGSNWSNYDAVNNNKASYRKTTSGVVILKGLVKKSVAAAAGDTIVTLPETYRPSKRLAFIAYTNNGSTEAVGRVDVETDGKVTYQSGSYAVFSLDNIHFIPNNGRYNTNPIYTLQNGWTNFGGIYTSTSYIKDDLNRVHTQGWIVPGTTTNGTAIFNMPSTLLPSEPMTMAGISSAFGAFGINSSSGGIYARGLGTSYLSINSMYYPKDIGSWSNLALAANTSTASNGTTPQFIKATDGLVTLKGYLNTVSIGAMSTSSLTAGYRPAKSLIFMVYANGAFSRVDVQASGTVYHYSGSASNVSLDSITYYADQ